MAIELSSEMYLNFSQISMSKSKNYRICLVEGDFFNKGAQNVQSFYHSLFYNFSLLSWINQATEIQIQDQVEIPSDSLTHKVYIFSINGRDNLHYLVEFQKREENGTICYSLLDKMNLKDIEGSLNSIRKEVTVTFTKQAEVSQLKRRSNDLRSGKSQIEERTTIVIDIADQNRVLEKLGVGSLQNHIQLKKNKLKPNELEYYYKQPLSKRYKQIPLCHFNIALQGGGAKGISYVGVFKALKELHPNIPITSIIGSSAGGILAMAISTEMKPQALSELCYKMDTIPNNKYFSNQSEITPQIQADFDKIVEKVKCTLHNNGILEGSIFDQLIQSLKDLETSEKILTALSYVNPSLAQLFSLQLKEPVPKKKSWFQEQKYYTNRFNYYGLLMAGMIKGDSVQTISARCIIDYFCKHFNPNYMKAHPHLTPRKEKIKKTLKKWGIAEEMDETDLEILLEGEQYLRKVKALTLKDYYAISGVELTSTSVDLDDQVLRFFNHKTTPDLPVCKSIQMSGSFPVAFQAQTWKQSYGKYYIHYSYTRKEVDLVGHTFTDGGLLANFPIKYLDNQEMRPMYFSHLKSPSKTILYGFGLDQIEDKVVDEEHEIQKKKAIEDLKKHIISNISKFSLLKNLIMSDSSVDLNKAKLQEIPLFNYLIKLLNTLSVADYNLNIECFTDNIVLTEVDPKAIESHKNVKKELEKFQIFMDSIEALRAISEAKKKSSFSEVVQQACSKMRDSLNQYETPLNSDIEHLRFSILSSLYNYQGTRIKYHYPQSTQIREFIRRIENIYPSETFRMQEKSTSKVSMRGLLIEIQAYCESLSGESKGEADSIYRKIIDSQLFVINQTHSRISQIMEMLRSHKGEEMENEIYNKITTLDYHIIYNFAGVQSRFFIIDQPFVTQIFQQISNLDLPGLKIENEVMSNTSQVESQLQQILRGSKRGKIHLVLQSKQNSHLYFCGLFQILQNTLHRQEHNSKTIDMITTSDMHSVFAFLLAGGKKIVNIRKEMWKIKDLVTFQTGIEEEYMTYGWAKTESREMQELVELAWADHYRIFEEMQEYLIKQNQNDLAEQIRAVRSQFSYSKDQVTSTMENILDYVTKSGLEALKVKDDPQLQKKRLAQFLSLKNGARGKDYTAKNEMISKNTQRFIKIMMQHFEQLLINVILDNFVVRDTFELVQDSATAEKVWKGALIKRLLSSKKLELYIKQKLEEMKLNHNTTLSQFYEFCPRKITLNFPLINKKKERMELINRFTSPNMPIWAAIIASTSMPLILPEFTFLQEWEFSPFSDSRMRKLVHQFFSSPEDSLKETYFSGNFVSTLPLQLLTNHKIARENYVDPRLKEQAYTQENKLCQAGTSQTFSNTAKIDSSEHIFITFAFSKRSLPNRKEALQVSKRAKKFFNFSNILNLGIDYMMGRFKNLEVGFKDILSRLQLLKYLSVRLECHDNTIMKLYYDQTIKLPISLGTLDFYRIESGRAQTLHACIYQSQFVVRGIFQNLQVSPDRQSFYYSAEKQTYLQFETFEEKNYLKFISKTKWNRKLATMYKIYWKLSQNGNYIPYDEEQIIFPDSFHQIYLKFDFPDTAKLIRRSHELMLDLSKLKDVEEAVFFKFNFEKLDKRYLLPVKLFSQRLVTRVIPPSKAIITENKIEESVARLYVEPSTIPIKIKPKSHSICDNLPKSKRPEECEDEVRPNVRYLTIKTMVNFKNDGLYCKQCVKPLSRAEHLIESENLDLRDKQNECSKCRHKGVILGYQCNNKKCMHPERNRYCFPCLFVYLLYIEEGVCRCTISHHELEYISMKDSKEIVLCHFCSNGAISYYRDPKCDINLCYKCSLILETKKLSN